MRRSLVLFLLLAVLGADAQHSFAFGDSAFLLDGKPFQIISGEMHYTRVPRAAWRQRFRMAKAMGLNTIGTYVFWNVHEPQNNRFDFSGNNDIAAFVRMAGEEGLWVILRPSPYVCAEWEFGGYPYWLQNIPGLKVRSLDSAYIREYRQYISAVGRQLAPLQVHRGGNILMIQVENEYGSYGNDKDYLALNRAMFREAGFDGPLYTCDAGPDLAKGSLPGLLPAVNGMDGPAEVKQLVRKNNGGKGPFFIAEWYPAWFDWWGAKHHTVPAEAYARRLDTVLAAGISINLYMFHGGTTRGFMNGANYNDHKPFEPQISSYDYDAPLDEAGNPTAKFWRFREVIGKHRPPGDPLPQVPAAQPVLPARIITLAPACGLLQNLPAPVASDTTLSFEDLAQPYGFVLYRTRLQGAQEGWLRLNSLRDFALVLINGKPAGTLDRRLKQDSLQLVLPAGTVQIDILVENMGRINYGPYLLENKKGLPGGASWKGVPLKGWQHFALPMDRPMAGKKGRSVTGPGFRKGSFELKEVPADLYLDMRGWGKGLVWVNGHHLGRYWRIGPQQTLYVPAEWLQRGRNEVMVFELLSIPDQPLKTRTTPVLDELQ